MKEQSILLVSPVGEIGGGEKVLLSLGKHLSKWQINPILICMRPGPLTELARQQGLTVYEFPRQHRYREIDVVLQAIQWLTQVIRETQADVIHANHASHIYTAIAARLTNTPEVWHLHDFPYKFDWIDKIINRLPSNHVIFTTDKVKSGYPRLQQYQHSVIPPACVDSNYLQSIAPQAQIRGKYCLPNGPLFLTVARFQEHKGHSYLIQAIPEVLRLYPDAVFGMIGKPIDAKQAQYQQTLELQVEELGIADRTKFLGFVPEQDLVSLYHSATALVHPALTEGFGLVLLEAMSLGIPVVAAAAAGPSELLTDRQTGLIVPTGDSRSLAEAIIHLLESPDLARTLQQEGKLLAESLSVDQMLQETVKIYHDLIRHI